MKNPWSTSDIRLLLWLLALPLLVCLVYWPGTTGALYYDDYANLSGLSSLQSGGPVWDFVFGGHAGPLGRPISLASFALQADAWPANATNFLQVNVVIHAANACLLFLLGLRTLELMNPTMGVQNARVAWSAALLWAVLPLLVSTTLITVQRMTGMSAFFGLLGLLAFAHGYTLARNKALLGFILQLTGLGAGTLLALYSKENGALIPLYAGVLEFVLLRRVVYPPAYRKILRSALIACLVVVLVYLSPLRENWFVVNEFRGFSPWQRLTTQVIVLWEYLRDAFIPQRPTAFGPFRDVIEVNQSIGRSAVAAVAWVALFGVSIALQLRRSFPWLLFAVAWFWAGHLLESTTAMLELVFEHRNYLPIYGFSILIAWSAWSATGVLARLAPLLLGLYTLMLMIITLAMTTLWGEPVKAAEKWADSHPGSARAALHAAFVEMDEANAIAGASAALIEQQKLGRAMHILDRTSKICPQCMDVKAQALIYACRVETTQDIRARFEELLHNAVKDEVTITLVDSFFPMNQLVELHACGDLKALDLRRFAEQLIQNPLSASPTYRTRLHFIAAMLAQVERDDSGVIRHLMQGELISWDAIPILQFQVHYALEQNRINEALAAIERRKEHGQFSSRAQLVAVLQDLQDLVAKESK